MYRSTSSLGRKNNASIFVVVLAMIMMMVPQVVWARCICGPADSLCLDGCGRLSDTK